MNRRAEYWRLMSSAYTAMAQAYAIDPMYDSREPDRAELVHDFEKLAADCAKSAASAEGQP